jgi:hypothetical protein
MKDEMRARVAHVEEMGNAQKILVRKPEGDTPLGRHRRTWEHYNLPALNS